MHNSDLKNIIQAVLMASGEPLSLEAIQNVFEDWEKPTIDSLKSTLDEMMVEYSQSGVELKLMARGYGFQTQPRYSTWVSRLWAEKPQKYSSALLETLAIIAYRQPVTRSEIEEVRGVSTSSAIIKTLLEREWIKIAGYRDVPGKPAVYTTTKLFLDYFNLSSLDKLPLLEVNNA